ncbi:MAG: glycosyltransferase [Lactobacillaceae bacterium]|jgi:poly(glycerol-phosphate) alpha-glucosyltransferase|nr:glycosyltransferase [Lactobacillaceae bacterium]
MLFVSENIFEFNSGTEFSQAMHVKLFNKHGINSKYVTKNHNILLHRAIRTVGLKDDEVLNMYDFFQGVDTLAYDPDKMLSLRVAPEIVKKDYHIEGVDANHSLIKHNGQLVGRIDVHPATVGMIGSITWYDQFGNNSVVETYDIRGFKSTISYFHPNGTIGTVLYLNKEGKPVLEVTHMNIGGNLFPTMFKLLGYKGKDRRFNSEDELFTFFLDEYLQNNPSEVVVERPNLYQAVANSQNAVKKFAYIHDSVFADPNNSLNINGIKSVYAPIFGDLANKFHGVIVAAQEQKNALSALFPNINIKVAADTILFPDENSDIAPKEFESQTHKILVLGRVAPEHRPSEVIKTFAEVKKEIPDAKLTFQGYFSAEEKRDQLEKRIESLGLEDSVEFSDYKTNDQLKEIIQDHQVLLSTSSSEGFGMQIVNAFEYGIPVVAYDVAFQVAQLVKEGGELVSNNDFRSAAKAIVKLLTDKDSFVKAHQNALENAKTFNSDNVFAQWQLAVQ